PESRHLPADQGVGAKPPRRSHTMRKLLTGFCALALLAGIAAGCTDSNKGGPVSEKPGSLDRSPSASPPGTPSTPPATPSTPPSDSGSSSTSPTPGSSELPKSAPGAPAGK